MNGYQRVHSALNGQATDCTPVMLHNFLLAIKEAGLNHQQYRSDPKLMAKAHIQAVETYQYDGILLDLDTVTLAGAVGVPVDFPPNYPARSHEPLLKELCEVEELKPVKLMDYPYIQTVLEAVSLLKAYFKDEIYIRGNCDQAPFSLASSLRTPQEFMLDLMDEDSEENVFKLLDYCSEVSGQYLSLMAKAGAHMLSNGDSPAGPSMISAVMYKKYALPYEKKMVEISNDLGLPYALHICGNTTSILEPMFESGAQAIELDYKTNIQLIEKCCRTKSCFIGNIDPTGVLVQGSPALVREKVIELQKQFILNPRFILNAGCAIPAETPSENLHALIRTARETPN